VVADPELQPNGADYVLMNPLSSMGRGMKARDRLSATQERMQHIYELTAPFQDDGLDMVHIRFPGTDARPLAGCQAGTIIYVFTPGEVTVCPYLVFAARTPQSRHDPAEFIVGNIFADTDIAARLDNFNFARRYPMGANPTCRSCGMSDSCGKGCPAAVISAGEPIGAIDAEVCPVTLGERRLLPLMPA
jgi:radical SAM protein with 4Fe4S-binding SPASM domain